MQLFNKLKDKWQVSWFRFILIIITFALGGSLCARAGNYLLSFFLTESDILYWIIYIPLVTLLWPLCVLLVSIPFWRIFFFYWLSKKDWVKARYCETINYLFSSSNFASFG